MSNKLPSTTALNSRGEEESVSIFPVPGTEADEVPLWQFFEERPVSDPAGTTSLLASSTTTLDEVYELLEKQAVEEVAVLQQERDDEDYAPFSFLLEDYKTLRVPAGKYKQRTCRFCKKIFKERKRLDWNWFYGGSTPNIYKRM